MESKEFTIVGAQLNPIVGNIEYNFLKIKDVVLHNKKADIIIFPEMALCGYPLQDHILDPLVQKQNSKYIDKIQNLDSNSTLIFGTFTQSKEIEHKIQKFYNSAIIIDDGKIIHIENKRLLPNYDIFDERRYFSYDNKFNPIELKGCKFGILICEDLWDDRYKTKVAKNLVRNGAEFLFVLNASPFHINKFDVRKELVCTKSKDLNVPIIYLNMIGGVDEIVYDGYSFVTNKEGVLIFKAKAFEEDIFKLTIVKDNESYKIKKDQQINYQLNWKQETLKALQLNLYDYYHKSRIFEGIVLGLSGGIDSAFTAYICAQAIGAENVHCLMMPTRYTSKESLDLSKALCENLGMNYKIHSIGPIFQSFENSLEKILGKLNFDVADENLQARIRANILMYYSNKYDWLVVSTGNKSEIGVGYCTLYGDTCGGKNVPGDLLKTQIYDLCEWINRDEEIIPKGIIERPPTAELKEDQKDSDSLPPYGILDQILEDLIQNGIGNNYDNLREQGIDKETIDKVTKLYLNSEYKRRQLVQTIKISKSAFGIGRRYPVLKKIKSQNYQ